MSVFPFNPSQELATEVINDLLSDSSTLRDIAERHNTTVTALSLWMASPDIQQRFDAFDLSIARRVRSTAIANLPAAANALSDILHAAIYAELNIPLKPGSIQAAEQRRRQRATTCKAAYILLQLARFQPVLSTDKRPAPHHPPTPATNTNGHAADAAPHPLHYTASPHQSHAPYTARMSPSPTLEATSSHQSHAPYTPAPAAHDDEHPCRGPCTEGPWLTMQHAPKGHRDVATGGASESSSERNPWKRRPITSCPGGAEESHHSEKANSDGDDPRSADPTHQPARALVPITPDSLDALSSATIVDRWEELPARPDPASADPVASKEQHRVGRASPPAAGPVSSEHNWAEHASPPAAQDFTNPLTPGYSLTPPPSSPSHHTFPAANDPSG